MKIQKTIGLPEELVDYIEKEARREKRSFSAQIELMIERAYEDVAAITAGNTQINPELLKKAK